MNYETIIIIVLSYALGVFSFWIYHRCEHKEVEEIATLPTNCPYVEKKEV